MLVRNITPKIIEALAGTPVVMLNGARQTGKIGLSHNLFICLLTVFIPCI
jgi:predicted AAA+ superfamily ATPase